MKTTVRLTDNERLVLLAIISSEYQDDSYVDHHVWTDYINPFPTKPSTLPGVITSLKRKGLVSIYAGTTAVTGRDPSTIALTQFGYDAMHWRSDIDYLVWMQMGADRVLYGRTPHFNEAQKWAAKRKGTIEVVAAAPVAN